MSDGKIDKKYLIRPYSYMHNSFGANIVKLFVMLLIQFSMLFLSKSYSSILIIAATVSASVLAEIICSLMLKQSLLENKKIIVALVQGLICGMLVPESYPLMAVFIVTFCTMIFTRQFFGGFAFCWVNPCAVTIAVLWIIGIEFFPDYLVSLEALAIRNPSQLLIENGAIKIFPFDSVITEFFNQTIFSILKVSVPEGYVSLFWDSCSCIPAFRFSFVTLISSIFLFNDNIFDIMIPALFIFTYVLLVRYISPFLYNGVTFKGDMLLALLTGGTLFCCVFLINWYGTVPVTIAGKIAYGFISGIVMFMISGCGTSPSGIIFTVIIANVISMIIQQYENHCDRIRIKKQLDLFINEDKTDIQGI